MIENAGNNLSRDIDTPTIQKEALAPALNALERLQAKIEEWNKNKKAEGWQLTMPEHNPQRVALCEGLRRLQDGHPIILGISLGNPYFTRETVSRLFRFLNSLAIDVYILVMDKPSQHNFRALGYTDREIISRIKKKSNPIYSSIKAAIDEISDPEHRFHVLNWDDIYTKPFFREQLHNLNLLYLNNPTFFQDLRKTVSDYLIPKLAGKPLTEDTYRHACEFLLEELAFLVCSNQILGAPKLSYLYHREWKIFERLAEGFYDIKLSSDLGFIELKVDS